MESSRFALLALLGIGTVSAVACRSDSSSEVRAETVQLKVTGMT
jgi:hypothetical protein